MSAQLPPIAKLVRILDAVPTPPLFKGRMGIFTLATVFCIAAAVYWTFIASGRYVSVSRVIVQRTDMAVGPALDVSLVAIVGRLEAQRTDLQSQRNALQSYLVPTHPSIVQLNQQLAAIDRKIIAEQSKIAAPPGKTLNLTVEELQRLQMDAKFQQNTPMVTGLVENSKRFEFATTTKTLADIMAMAKSRAQATQTFIARNTGIKKSVEYYPLGESSGFVPANGGEVEFAADKKLSSITVRVEGENQSPQEYVLPYGTHMGVMLKKIEFSERSETESLQLFRLSVKERQRQSLQVALESLETAALTARSGSSNEARLSAEEAGLLLQW